MGKAKDTLLTDTQIKFCEWVAKGKTQTEAYRLTHPKANDATSRRNAVNLMKRPEVQEKIQDIMSSLAFKMQWSKEKSEKTVGAILDECMLKGDHKTALLAVQELNKMAGLYAPQKQITAKVDLSHGDINAIMDNLGYKRIEQPREIEVISE